MKDKAKIKAEIERLKGKLNDDSSYSNGWKHAIRMIEIFINSLQEEPVSEDLEEFITVKYNGLVGIHGEFDKTYIDGMAKAIAIECGVAGAQWQKCKDIDKACKWLTDNLANYFGHDSAYSYIEDFRKALEEA